MTQKSNPIPRTGERNIYCPTYNDCLDLAAKRYWETWDCSQCPNRAAHQAILDNDRMIDPTFTNYELPAELSIPSYVGA